MKNLQAHCSLQMLSVHLVQLTVTSLRTKQISLLHMKKKLVVTTQISLVNTVLKYKMQFAKFLVLKLNALLHFMVQSGVHLKQFNTSCTNTCTGPTIQLRKKALLSPSDLCMVTLVPSHNNWLNNYPNVVLQISKSTMFPKLMHPTSSLMLGSTRTW